MGGIKKARAELQRYYTLTNQFRVQLQALDEAVPSVRIEIRKLRRPETPTPVTSWPSRSSS